MFQPKLKHFFLLPKTYQLSRPNGPILVKSGIWKKRYQIHLNLNSQKQEDNYLKFVLGMLKSKANPKLSDSILSQPPFSLLKNELFIINPWFSQMP